MPFKHCAGSYRNVKGIRYEQYTDNVAEFPEAIEELKQQGRKYKLDKRLGRLWAEVVS